jgi:hypothetical protein
MMMKSCWDHDCVTAPNASVVTVSIPYIAPDWPAYRTSIRADVRWPMVRLPERTARFTCAAVMPSPL